MKCALESPLASKLRGPHRDDKMSRIAFTEREKTTVDYIPGRKKKETKVDYIPVN